MPGLPPIISRGLSDLLLDRDGRHRRRVLERWHRLQAFDRLDDGTREQVCRIKLAALLSHVAQHVPRYKRILGGRSVSAGESLEVLKQLPVTMREEIQENRDDFCDERRPPARQDATGGSTGTPMTFLVDSETHLAREASLMWSDSLAGWRPGHRIAMLWGSDQDVAAATREVRLWLRWFIENRRWFNAFDMSEAKMEEYHRRMTGFRPHLLVAYAGAVHELACFLEERGSSASYPLLSIVSSAEVLTRQMREKVERVFGKPVFDRYGNREAGAIAAECKAHQGLHVNEYDFILEIDSPDPGKEPGRILITYLSNYAMPLIRYDTGDLGLWAGDEVCGCGRNTRRLQKVVGRSSDFIVTPDGRRIHGEYFTHLLYGKQGIRRFQFIQEDRRRYRLILEPEGDGPGETVVQRLQEQLMRVLGGNCAVSVELVGRLDRLPSGKFCFTVNRWRRSVVT